ncbi:MAG: hypothetical protein CVT69_01020 [Actinobacteria bacterium HGW-Actinobacteria-9]|nr:MAG: hypothetical protein CVT69_01020 [Actinobacteria bacterium HGW-Actinobacteria-9]
MSESVGERLSAARRSKGKSLIEVEAATRIRAKLLEALEKGNYDVLPNAAYVRGYIISVAKYLEMDPGPLLAAYASETGEQTNREQMRVPRQVVPSRERQHAIPWGTALLIAGGLVAIALAVWLVGLLTAEPEPLPPVPNVAGTTPTAETTPPPGTVETGTVAPDTETATMPEIPTDTPASDPFTLSIDIADDGASWLRVTVDGLKAYEGTLAGGQSKEWEVNESAIVRVGKPSSVTIRRDGDELEIPSAAETPEMTITSTEPAVAE